MSENRKEILRARDEISVLTNKIRALCEILSIAATGETPVQAKDLQYFSEVIADLADDVDETMAEILCEE